MSSRKRRRAQNNNKAKENTEGDKDKKKKNSTKEEEKEDNVVEEKEKEEDGGEQEKEIEEETEDGKDNEPEAPIETKQERKKRKRAEKVKKLVDAAVDFNTKLLLERYKRGPTYWDPHTRTLLYYDRYDVCLVPEVISQSMPPPPVPNPLDQSTRSRDSPVPFGDLFTGFFDKGTTREMKRLQNQMSVPHCHTCGVEDKEDNLMSCLDCGDRYHVECLELKPEYVEKMKSYGWKCMHCKTCEICKDSGNEEKLLFCDACDRGFHTFCLKPPLLRNPTGAWYCSACVQCKSCGSKSPGVGVSCRWRAEYTMCEACYQLLTENKYCPKCRKVYRQIDILKNPMVQCSSCKWKYHISCDEEGANEEPYICHGCRSGEPINVKPEEKRRIRRKKSTAAETKDSRRSSTTSKRSSSSSSSSSAKRGTAIPTVVVTPPVNENNKRASSNKRKRDSSSLKKTEKAPEMKKKKDKKRSPTRRTSSPKRSKTSDK